MEKENLKLNRLIQDITLLLEITPQYNEIQTKKLTNPLTELLEYAINSGIIKNTKDVVTLCLEFPNLKNKITNMYDDFITKKTKKTKETIKIYNCLEDAPGYGIEWNSRCIPDNIIIRKTNRC